MADEFRSSFVGAEKPQTASSVYPSANPSFARFASRRSPVHSTKGAVACSQPLAARAGIKILDQGGNAADAAVAVAAALNVTEPSSTGIGGDLFCLYYNAKTRTTHALNGSGRSSHSLTIDQLRQRLKIANGTTGKIPFRSIHSVTVPGAAAGWVDTVEKFGSGKVSLKDVLTPAIELAEKGFPVSELSAFLTGDQNLRSASPNFREMLKPAKDGKDGCRPPRPGEIFRSATLAQTFRALAEEGRKGFYEGRIAEAMIEIVKDFGGALDLEDLKRHGQVGSEEVEPISIKFSGQGIELWEHPPNGQGLVALLALGIFQEMEKLGKIPKFREEDHNSVEHLHAMIEALRLAFSDSRRYVGDPAKVEIPIKELLSPEYLASRAKSFDPKAMNARIDPRSTAFSASDTVYLAATDSEGNACSFINSNYGGFGTGIIPKGCGFTLQNRGALFDLGPEGHPNIYAPGKRPYHTIIPAMVTRSKDQSLWACYGVMGGFMQPQGHLQVLLNMAVFGLNPQEALDAPRICIESPGPDGVDTKDMEQVFVEDGISPMVADGLRELGHNVYEVASYERGLFGRGQVIRCHEEEGRLVYTAGSDLRGDGHAAPQ